MSSLDSRFSSTLTRQPFTSADVELPLLPELGSVVAASEVIQTNLRSLTILVLNDVIKHLCVYQNHVLFKKNVLLNKNLYVFAKTHVVWTTLLFNQALPMKDMVSQLL